MVTAKAIRVERISGADARRVVSRLHYSGRFVKNSQLHLGVFLAGRCEGVMSFGPPMDKRKLQGLVAGTAWNGFCELNRMAFSERLPRNSESRALGVAMRMLRADSPHIEWVVSFADGTQCGDGTIYRAAGFVLTGIVPNKTIYRMPSGAVLAKMTLEANWDAPVVAAECAFLGVPVMPRTMPEWQRLGAVRLPGHMLRYVYFTNPAAASRLNVPVIPFDKIAELGAGMYRGQPITRDKHAMAGALPAQRRGSADHPAPPPPGVTP